MYYFYINGVLLPVTPEKLNISIKNQNKTVNLVDGSEFNILKTPGLSEISFDCLLPNVRYPFAIYESNVFQPAHYYLQIFEELKINKSNFKFRVIRHDGFGNTSFDCALESYTVKEDAKNGFDFLVSVKLKQYSYKKTNILSFTNDADNSAVTIQEERPVSKTKGTKSYTIVSGDTLWGIAKKYYGDGSRYTEIYADNTEVIENAAKARGRASSSNGHWIYPGTVITVKDAII